MSNVNTFSRPGKWANDDEKALKLDTLNEVKKFFYEQFGESVWIPREGISKNGNIYITLVLKYDQALELWYVGRTGDEP